MTKVASGGVTIFSAMSSLADELGAINLGQGFPDFNTDQVLIDAVARCMRDGHNQYAPMRGVTALREALSRKVETLYGRKYDPATEIVITSGATEALFSSLTALVRPGDEVVLFEPAYDSYLPAVQLSGGIPVFVTLRAPDFRVDWDEVRRAVNVRTRAIVINSPHNPTGTIFDERDLRELADVLQRTDAVVVSDEVYEHIVFDGARHESVARHPDIASRAIVISSFGKTYHATGWKIGYCCAPEPLAAAVAGVHQWVTYAVNTPIQRAYAECVERDPACEAVTRFYQAKRDTFLELIRESRFKPLPCRGTFFQLLDYSTITGDPDSEFALRLVRDHGVASIPLSPFLSDSEAGTVLRFCFGKRDETLKAAAERLCRV